MSKAKERALEKYPLLADDDKEGLEALKYVGMECDCASEYNEVQESIQAYFIEGYNQAEKDLKLTWEDMMAIDDLLDELLPPRRDSDELALKGYYEEILKRFKERKEK